MKWLKQALKKALKSIKEFVVYVFTEQRKDGIYRSYDGERIEVVEDGQVIYDSHFEGGYR